MMADIHHINAPPPARIASEIEARYRDDRPDLYGALRSHWTNPAPDSSPSPINTGEHYIGSIDATARFNSRPATRPVVSSGDARQFPSAGRPEARKSATDRIADWLGDSFDSPRGFAFFAGLLFPLTVAAFCIGYFGLRELHLQQTSAAKARGEQAGEKRDA